MASAREIEAGRATVRILTEDSQFTRGLHAAERRFGVWAQRLNQTGTTLLAGAFGVGAPLAASVTHFAAAGSELNDLAARTGASTTALQTLSFAARMTGADAAALEVGIRQLGNRVADAATGNRAADAVFRELGLSAAQLAALPLDVQFERIADRLSQLPEGALRTQAAIDLFGRSGTELLPMLVDGGAALAAYGRRLEELGVIKTPEAIAAADQLGDQLDEVKLVLSHTAFTIGDALAPAVSSLAEDVIAYARAANEWIDQNRETVTTVAIVTAGVGAAGGAMLALGSATYIASAAFGGLAAAAGLVVSPLGLVAIGAGAVGAALTTQTAVGRRALLGLRDTAVATWDGIVAAISSGELALAGNIALAGLEVAWQTGLGVLRDAWSEIWASIAGVFDATILAIQRKMLNVQAELTRTRFEIGIKFGINTEQEKRAALAPIEEARRRLEAAAERKKVDRNEELAAAKAATQQRIKAAQDRLEMLIAEAARRKDVRRSEQAKAELRTREREELERPSVPEAAAAPGRNMEATTSGLAASLNRSFVTRLNPVSEMHRFGTVTDSVTRKIDEQTAALERRNRAAAVPPAAAKAPPAPPEPPRKPAAKELVPPRVENQPRPEARRQPLEATAAAVAASDAAVREALRARGLTDEQIDDMTAKEFEAERSKLEKAGTIPEVFVPRTEKTPAPAELPSEPREATRATLAKPAQLPKPVVPPPTRDRAELFAAPRPSSLGIPMSERARRAQEAVFAAREKRSFVGPHSLRWEVLQGQNVPEAKGDVARERELDVLTSAIGAFTPGERLKALKDLRAEKGFPDITPLSEIARRFPEELRERLERQRREHVARGEMPKLELKNVAGGEPFTRGVFETFTSGAKIVSPHKPPAVRHLAQIDAAIREKERQHQEAAARATALRGIAAERAKPSPPKPPTLIKREPLPISDEARQLLEEAAELRKSVGTRPREEERRASVLNAVPPSIDSAALMPALPNFAEAFAQLRMPEFPAAPNAPADQRIVQTMLGRDAEKLDAIVEQLKTLNANVRTMGVLTS